MKEDSVMLNAVMAVIIYILLADLMEIPAELVDFPKELHS